MSDAPTPAEKLRGLADRFQGIVHRATAPRLAPQPKPPEPTDDERLEAAIINWLRDDKPVEAVLAWLDTEAMKANAHANSRLQEPNQVIYALGVESAYRAVATRFRIIRSKQ